MHPLSPLAALIGLALSAPAQGNGDLFELSLEELSQVEVSVASRNPEQARLAPASVTVFTHEEIQRLGLRSLTELLNRVPGVQALFEPTEGRDNSLQGRGTPESYGQSFLLLLDGKRLNEHYTGGFTLANRFVALGNVERVEVIRGPGSALYGGNAFSGVINIVTATERRELRAAAGSHEGRQLAANWHEAGEDWQMAAFVQAYGDEGERYSGIFDRFGRQDSTRDPRENYDAYVSAEWGSAFARARYTRHRLNDYYTFRRVSDGINEDVNSQTYGELGYRLSGGETWEGTLSASHSETHWQPFARLALQGPDFPQADLLQGPRLYYRQWQAAGDFAYRLSDRHRLNAGFLLEKADIPLASERGNYDVVDGHYLGGVVEQRSDIHRFVEDRPRRILGLYLQDQFDLGEAWHATAGLRYDRYNDIGDSLSPRLALVYTPDEADTLKLLYGEGFRAPGLGDLYDRDAGQTLGNPNLDPITNRTIELAWQHQGSGWQAGATLFDTHAKGLLSSVATPDGRARVDNIGHNESRGIELEAAAELGESWQFSASYTRILDNETRGIPDPAALLAEDLAADAYGAWSLNYRQGAWNFNLNGLWRAELPILPEDSAYHPVNLVTTWQASGDWQWQLGLYNLGDEAGHVVARGSGLGRRNGQIERAIPLRGREAWLSLAVRY